MTWSFSLLGSWDGQPVAFQVAPVSATDSYSSPHVRARVSGTSGSRLCHAGGEDEALRDAAAAEGQTGHDDEADRGAGGRRQRSPAIQGSPVR